MNFDEILLNSNKEMRFAARKEKTMKVLIQKPKARHHLSRYTAQRGFTLIEMAIVLVIIGIIVGGVMIGRDVQRSAEFIRIRQTFINQWAQAYNTYFQRNGVPVGDNLLNRTLQVGGASGAIVCQGAAPPPGTTGASGGGASQTNLLTQMLRNGVTLPEGNGPGREDSYVYLDDNGNSQTLRVCFLNNPPGTASGAGNVMVITGLTPDLARSLAQGINGNGSAVTGAFRQAVPAPVGGQWATNTVDAAVVNSNNTNDDLQTTVTAHYRMNQ